MIALENFMGFQIWGGEEPVNFAGVSYVVGVMDKDRKDGFIFTETSKITLKSLLARYGEVVNKKGTESLEKKLLNKTKARIESGFYLVGEKYEDNIESNTNQTGDKEIQYFLLRTLDNIKKYSPIKHKFIQFNLDGFCTLFGCENKKILYIASIMNDEKLIEFAQNPYEGGMYITSKGVEALAKFEKEKNLTGESKGMIDKAKVFVIHGRNEKLRKSMFDFLRSIGLKPIEWTEAIKMTGKTSPYIGEILDAAFSNAQAIISLMSPDDEARLLKQYASTNEKEYELNLSPQARPNVIFETGMAFGRDQERTIIVEIGELRPFSDIAGRHVIKLNNTPTMRQELANRLKLADCDVNSSGTDWYHTGDFNLE